MDLVAAGIKHKASLFAHDLVIFISPCEQDVVLVKAILDAFAAASGLYTNVNKC